MIRHLFVNLKLLWCLVVSVPLIISSCVNALVAIIWPSFHKWSEVLYSLLMIVVHCLPTWMYRTRQQFFMCVECCSVCKGLEEHEMRCPLLWTAWTSAPKRWSWVMRLGWSGNSLQHRMSQMERLLRWAVKDDSKPRPACGAAREASREQSTTK